MRITMNRDLTTGKPETVLWKFCLPLFGSIIFQQLYNIADSLVAGRFIGENALAAVGNSYEITLIFIAFAFGCNMGCSVIVSQLFGAKDPGMPSFTASDPHTGGSFCRFAVISGYLCVGTPLCVFLQYCHWNFFRTGGFQDTLLFPCGFLHLEHCRGYPFRNGF